MLRLVRGKASPEEPESSRLTDPLGPLARAASAGDMAAARTLLVTVAPTILRAVRGVLGSTHPDVADVAQDVSLALLESLPAFRGECSLRHYASRIAVRRAINARRQLGFRRRWVADWPFEEEIPCPDSGPSSAELVESARRWRAMFALLHSIPEPQAEALVLHFILGHTVEEIASMLSAPVNTVRSRLRLAKGTLRERIGDDRELADWQEEGGR